MNKPPIPAAAAPGPGSGHLDFLDGLRAVAALYVLFHHLWLQIWEGHFPGPFTRHLTGWLYFGHFGVVVFIVLSGFCLMLPVVRGGGTLRGGTLGFFKRRALRIVPPYYMAILVSLLLIVTVIGKQTGTHWDASIPVPNAFLHVGKKDVVYHFLLLQDFRGVPHINHVFWSVALEWHIYFLFPLLVLSWRKVGPWLTTAVALPLAYLVWAAGLPRDRPFSPEAHQRWMPMMFYFLGLFVLGMLGATMAFGPSGRWPQRRQAPGWAARWLTLAACCAAAVIAFCSVRGMRTAYNWFPMNDLFIGLGTMALLVAASRPGPNGARAVLSFGPFVWVGTFSYSLYLIHAPLLQIVWQYLVHPLRLRLHLRDGTEFLLLCAISVPACLAVAYGFFALFERPFMSRRRLPVSPDEATPRVLEPTAPQAVPTPGS